MRVCVCVFEVCVCVSTDLDEFEPQHGHRPAGKGPPWQDNSRETEVKSNMIEPTAMRSTLSKVGNCQRLSARIGSFGDPIEFLHKAAVLSHCNQGMSSGDANTHKKRMQSEE